MSANGPTIEEATRASDVDKIITAASKHDLVALQQYLNSLSFEDCKPADVQDSATGYTPLHAAIASCQNGDAHRNETVNGDAAEPRDEETDAYEALKVLFDNGAIWNQLDRNDETPGCIAYRLGLNSLYQSMVDAGVRAELLLNRLDEYEELEDVEDMDVDQNDQQVPAEDNESDSEAPQLVLTTAEGETTSADAAQTPFNADVESSAYLSSTLSLDENKLLDDSQNGVMMAWESGIMEQSADELLPTSDLKVLNIGFGMGIIDSHIQAHTNTPKEHHIVEAHPDVLESLRSKGWFDKPGVFVHSGKWQDILPKLVSEGHTFDAIYYDTFAESYHDFRDFFSEHLIGLLEQDGRWSYFNGMGADRQISYDVYQKIVEIDLMEAGFDIEWTDVELPDLGQEWKNVRRKYWNVDQYRLPLCKFMD